MSLWLSCFLCATVALVPRTRARAQDAPAPVARPVAELKRDTAVSFEKDILPILSANCLACHNRTKAKGDLVLETPTDILKGGESGAGVVPRKSEESLLLKVSAHRVEPVMPPKGNKVAAADLSAEQLGLIKLWIDQGATGTIGGASVPTVQWQAVPAGLNAIYAVAVSPDGQYAACARGAEVHVYHLPSAKLVSRLGGHRDLVQSLAFSPDGMLLASGAYREVKLWRRPRDVKKFSVTSMHRGGVNAADTSPDGAMMVTGGADGAVRLWGASDGRPVRDLSGHGGAVTAVRFSPDGTRVASASADRTIHVWNVADGAILAQTRVDAEPAAVAWLAGGTQLAAAGGDAVVRVWDMPAPAGAAFGTPKELKGHDGAVTTLAAVSGAPTHLLSGGADGTVRRWDVNSGAVVRQVSHWGPVSAVAVRADGKRVASAGGTIVRLWDAEGKPVAEMKGDRYANEAAAGRARDLAFAATEVTYHKGHAEALDKRGAEQVGRVKKAALADAEAEKSLAEKQKAKADAEGKKAEVVAKKAEAEKKKGEAAAKKTEADAKKVKADAEATAIGTAATKVEADVQKAVAAMKQAEAEAKQADVDLKQAEEAAKQADVAVKQAQAEAAKAGAEAGKAQVAKAAAADELRLAIKSAQGAADAAAEAASALQAAEGEHKQVEVEAAALKAAAAAEEKPVVAVAFSADGAVLAAGGDGGAVHTYHGETGVGYETFRGHSGSVRTITFAGATVVSGGADGFGIGWDMDGQWSRFGQLGTGGSDSPLADRVTALDFGADGKYLTTGGGVPSRDGEVTVWDVERAVVARRFEGLHSDAVFALDLSHDGKFLATAAADRFVKVSEVASGRLVKSFEGHTGHVLGVAFARGGRTLASGAADNTVKVWDLVSGEQKKAVGGFEKEVTSVRFVGDAEQFVAAAGDGKIRLLRPDGGEVRAFAGAAGFVYAAAVTRDGSVVLAGGEDGTLRAWDVATGQATATLPVPAAATAAR